MRDRATAPRVLLVEDNPGDADLIAEVVGGLGLQLELRVATDADQAQRVLDDGPRPALVLLDLNLPRRGGLEVLRRIRATPAQRAIPVVVLTSSTSAHDVSRAYELGANCYLTKPMGLGELQELMGGALRFWLTQVQLPP